jgi:hypothetical protein
VTLVIDTSRPLRSPAAQVELVQAVLAADETDETEWVEWKSLLDLTRAEGRFAIASQILGFANRHPDRASRFVGGCAYLIVGAEPGTMSGQPVMDPADLDNALRPYLGDAGPVWSPLWPKVSGCHVLVVTVEAPRWGDPIFVLRKAFDRHEDGTVFVRRPGATRRASAAEMDHLLVRLLQRRGPLEMTELHDPFGFLDAIHALGGLLHVRGWAADPDIPTSPIKVAVAVNGTLICENVADHPRPDVAAARPGFGSAHGFAIDLPVEPGEHVIEVNARNVGPGKDTLLGRDVVRFYPWA